MEINVIIILRYPYSHTTGM